MKTLIEGKISVVLEVYELSLIKNHKLFSLSKAVMKQEKFI